MNALAGVNAAENARRLKKRPVRKRPALPAGKTGLAKWTERAAAYLHRLVPDKKGGLLPGKNRV